MPTTRLYLIRHGQTDWNVRAALQGQVDIPLNETGKKQAAAAREMLAGLSFDAVYSSPLTRAMQTAELATGLPADKIQPDERIKEISFGVWEGRSTSELGDAVKPFFIDPPHYQPPENAESLEHLMQRTGDFADFVLREHAGQTILAAGHGASLHALITKALGNPLEKFWQADLGNCCIAVLESNGGPFELKEVRRPAGTASSLSAQFLKNQEKAGE